MGSNPGRRGMFELSGGIAARERDARLSRVLRQGLGKENRDARRLVRRVIRYCKNVLCLVHRLLALHKVTISRHFDSRGVN